MYRCHMDGEIVQDDYMKMACLKIEEAKGTGGGGPTVALVQQLQELEVEREFENFIREHGASSMEKEAKLGP